MRVHTFTLQRRRERANGREEKRSVRSVFRKKKTVSLAGDSWPKKKKENARARARTTQKSDATCLIYDAVTHALYNSLIALSAYR